MHCAIETGTSEHGAMSSVTRAVHSRFSRGMSELVSTPESVISGSGAAGSLDVSPADCPWQVEAPELMESARTRAAAA
jgi:hypothetical protein